jgi:hypothetical protein
VSAGFFPAVVAGFCIDPNGETRAFGADAPSGIDKVCTEQFNGDCEVYKSYGLQRVVTLRYVDGGGSTGTVDVVVSRFASVEGAYGFFTRRLIGGSDPVARAPEELGAGTIGALGAGSASVWRGTHVAELIYTNPDEPPQRAIELGRAVLGPLATKLGEKLPGERTLPAAVAELPEEHRVRFGISYELGELLGVHGTGAGAYGFYQQGKQRWRVLCIVRPDEAGAKDVAETIYKALGAKTMKGVPFAARSLTLTSEGSGPKLSWVVARAGNRVFGVGDEEYALGPDRSAPEAAEVSLSGEAKLAQLQRLVQDSSGEGAADAGPQADR